MNFLLYSLMLVGADVAPATDPGNDPLITVLATVVFIIVSLGGGMLAFKAYNRKKP